MKVYSIMWIVFFISEKNRFKLTLHRKYHLIGMSIRDGTQAVITIYRDA